MRYPHESWSSCPFPDQGWQLAEGFLETTSRYSKARDGDDLLTQVRKYIQIPALHEQATSRTRVLLMKEFGSLRVRGECAVGTPAWGRARPPVHGAGSCGHQCAAPAHDAAADRESRW